MKHLHDEQALLEKIYKKDRKATIEILPRFVKAVKYFLREQGCDRREIRDDLINETLVQLYNKKEIPKLTVQLNTYLVSIAKNLFLDRRVRSKEDYKENSEFERYSSIDNIISQMEIDESKKILNNLILQLSPRCRELLEKILLDTSATEICREMPYASMSMFYKKKSQCMDMLKAKGKMCKKCCEFYNFD